MDGTEVTPDSLSTSSDPVNRMNDQSDTNDARSAETNTGVNAEVKPHRIEIKTLVQDMSINYNVLRSDEEFADALNEGWEVMDISFTSHPVETFGDRLFVSLRNVTLTRLVEDDGTPDEAQTEAETLISVEPPAAADAMIDALMVVGADQLHPVGGSQIDEMPVPVGVTRTLTYAEACASGQYTTDELRAIALNELREASLSDYAAWQPQISPVTGQAWEGLKFEHPARNLQLIDGG